VHEIHPLHGHANGIKSMHARWHLARGIFNPKCELCLKVRSRQQ